MKWRNITANDLVKVVGKLSLEPSKSNRRAPHPVYWYCLDRKKILRVTLPNVHGGSGSISTGFLTQVRKSLRLDTPQFEKLAECPLTSEEYEVIIREKLGL
jgi:hypothetical protein